MTRVTIYDFTGTTPARVYYCDSMSASCVFVASTSTFPYSFDVPPPYDENNFIVKTIDALNCEIGEFVYVLPSPTPTTTQTPFLTPSITSTETPTPSVTVTTTITPSSSPQVTPSRTPFQTPLPFCTPTVTSTVTPSVTPSIGLPPTVTPSNTPTNTMTPTITPTPSVTSTITPSVTETSTPTPTTTTSLTPSVTNTETPTMTPTSTVTPTVTQTPTTTITPSITISSSPTPTITSTITPTPSMTPEVLTASFLFVESNQVAVRNQFNTYMASQGSAWRGFNINGVTTNNANTFNNQMNAYLRYNGWGTVQPRIFTGFSSNISRGVDSFGNPVIANRVQTTIVPSGTTPNNIAAWYTWFVPTAATNNLRYSGFSVNQNVSGFTPSGLRAAIANNFVNYTGSTNIPQGIYRVYTTYTNQGWRITQNTATNRRNLYFRGGGLTI